MENTKLTERFPISENGWLIQDFNGIHRLVKLTVNKDFLAVLEVLFETFDKRLTSQLRNGECFDC